MASAPYDLPELTDDVVGEQPLRVGEGRVKGEWVDINGHMNVGYYSVAFDHATDAVCRLLGCSDEYVQHKLGMVFVLESHLTYQRELKAAEPFHFCTQLLGCDDKRLHLFHTMCNAEQQVAATNELLLMNIGFETRRAAPWPQFVMQRIQRLCERHARLPVPSDVGRVISLARRRPTPAKM